MRRGGAGLGQQSGRDLEGGSVGGGETGPVGRGWTSGKDGVGLGDRVGRGQQGRRGSFWRKDGAGPAEKGWEAPPL